MRASGLGSSRRRGGLALAFEWGRADLGAGAPRRAGVRLGASNNVCPSARDEGCFAEVCLSPTPISLSLLSSSLTLTFVYDHVTTERCLLHTHRYCLSTHLSLMDVFTLSVSPLVPCTRAITSRRRCNTIRVSPSCFWSREESKLLQGCSATPLWLTSYAMALASNKNTSLSAIIMLPKAAPRCWALRTGRSLWPHYS